MTQESTHADQGGWLDASGLPHIIRTLGIAVQPAKLGIALAALVATFALGTVLDGIWPGGVQRNAIERFINAQQMDKTYTEEKGGLGVFKVWHEHQRQCVLGLLGSSVPGVSVAAGTPVGTYIESHSAAQPLRNLAGMLYGTWWLLCCHPVFFILFIAGGLLIWSLGGGAICRLAAVQFAQDDKLSMEQGLAYSTTRLFSGFFTAPCIPLAFIVIVMFLLAVGGVVLRIPIFGDLVAGPLFIFALIGGFAIAALLVGLVVGGSLLWPVVATEGADAFEAFQRGLSYPFSRPWKAILYAVIATVYAGLCWLVVNLFCFFALTVTREVVAFGTSPFGRWSRAAEASESTSKMELLWPLAGPNELYSWPGHGALSWYEYFSAFCIGFYVLLVIGLMWAFLASFYFSASTIVYFLLRRDVDGTDLEEVYVEQGAPLPGGPSPVEVTPKADVEGKNISLPVANPP